MTESDGWLADTAQPIPNGRYTTTGLNRFISLRGKPRLAKTRISIHNFAWQKLRRKTDRDTIVVRIKVEEVWIEITSTFVHQLNPIVV